MEEKITLGNTIDLLIARYNDAVNDMRIRKPMAYALYVTWKLIDAQEKERMQPIDEEQE